MPPIMLALAFAYLVCYAGIIAACLPPSHPIIMVMSEISLLPPLHSGLPGAGDAADTSGGAGATSQGEGNRPFSTTM